MSVSVRRNKEKEKMNLFHRCASWTLAVALVVFNLLLSLHLVALNREFYHARWAALGVPQDTGMSLQDLDIAGQSLIDYFRGIADTPQVETRIFGQTRPLYNGTELSHLKDVRALFKGGLSLEKASLAIIAVIGLYLAYSRSVRILSRALLGAGLASLAILVLVSIPAAVNFTVLWTGFHLAAFSNDLWLLDPQVDWLIRMFPEDFFSSCAARAGLYSAIMSGTYMASAFLIRHFSPDHGH